jgi:hypothetical protein
MTENPLIYTYLGRNGLPFHPPESRKSLTANKPVVKAKTAVFQPFVSPVLDEFVKSDKLALRSNFGRRTAIKL